MTGASGCALMQERISATDMGCSSRWMRTVTPTECALMTAQRVFWSPLQATALTGCSQTAETWPSKPRKVQTIPEQECPQAFSAFLYAGHQKNESWRFC